MKEILKNFIQAQIDDKKKLLEVSNAMSDEDRTLVENAIQNLQTILEKVDAADENQAAIDELKNTVETLNQSLTAVQEKLQQKQEDITQDNDTTMENTFLNTKESVHAFANAIRNARNGEEFLKNWSDVLLENGITIAQGSEQGYLPTAVLGTITDLWDKQADWLKDLNFTGAKRFYVRHNTSDANAETSRAKGWKKGDTKVEQSITLSAKLLEPQVIYKIQTIDSMSKFQDDNSLVNYILSELVGQLIAEMKRCVLVSDGRAANSDYKINSFEAIAKTTTDAYTTVSTVTANGFLVDDMRAMVDSIENPNSKPVYVFMGKQNLRQLSRIQGSSSSTPVYIPVQQVAEQLGCDRIITTDLLGENFAGLAFIPSEYYVVGQDNILNPTLFQWHEGFKNLDCYRYEVIAGGGINALKSSAVLKTA